jgi:hypothetical protein
MSEGFQKAQRDLRQAGEGGRHHHHHRADPRQAGAQADHRRNGAVDESGQRHRRHGRRAGRQLRADRAGNGDQGTGWRSSATAICRAGCRNSRARFTHQPLPPGRGTVQEQGRHRSTSTWTTKCSAARRWSRKAMITWPPPAPKLSAAPAAAAPAAKPVVVAKKSHGKGSAPASAPPWPALRRRRADLLVHRRRARRGLPRSLHGFRPGLLRRLHGGLECHPRLAHAADERHQCDQQHHRHRRPGADRAAPGCRALTVRTTGFAGWPSVPSCWRRSTCSVASPLPSACWLCSANRS